MVYRNLWEGLAEKNKTEIYEHINFNDLTFSQATSFPVDTQADGLSGSADDVAIGQDFVGIFIDKFDPSDYLFEGTQNVVCPIRDFVMNDGNIDHEGLSGFVIGQFGFGQNLLCFW
jgi:hypothetical protein